MERWSVTHGWTLKFFKWRGGSRILFLLTLQDKTKNKKVSNCSKHLFHSFSHTHIILSSHTFLGDSSNLRCLVWSRFSGGKTKKRGLFKLAPTFWHRKHVYLYPRVQEGLLSHAAGRIEAITVAIFEEQERLRGVSQSKTSLSCEHHHGNLELQLNPQISWLVPFSDICGVYQTPDWHLFQSKC